MNVIKVIRPVQVPVKLIRTAPGPIKLVRAQTTVQLINTGGVVIYGGSNQASQITTQAHFAALYKFKKQI